MKLRSVGSRSSNGSKKQKNSRRNSNAPSKKKKMIPFLNRKSGKSDEESCSSEDLDDGEEPKQKTSTTWLGFSRKNSDSSKGSDETEDTFTRSVSQTTHPHEFKHHKSDKLSSPTVSARKSAASKVITFKYLFFYISLLFCILLYFDLILFDDLKTNLFFL